MFFNYDSYLEFLLKARNQTKILPLGEFVYGMPGIYLRHDVDLSVNMAFRMAELEHGHNVRSSYFFMVSGCYNILEQANRQKIKKMSDNGFDIGLHFDPAVYDDKLPEHLETEKDILENVTERPVKSVSLHNLSIHNLSPLFDGYINAYDPQIFPDNYYSDSCMDFRGKSLEDAITESRKKPVQILIHPAHYNHKTDNCYADLCRSLMRERLLNLHDLMSTNRAYQKSCNNMIRDFVTDIQEAKSDQ